MKNFNPFQIVAQRILTTLPPRTKHDKALIDMFFRFPVLIDIVPDRKRAVKLVKEVKNSKAVYAIISLQ